MGSRLIALGHFSFKSRGYLLPIAVLLLIIPGPRLLSDPLLAGILGFAFAVLGQAVRVATIGLDYIVRGGKDRKVYAETLVTGGLYSHCRNPMYLGNVFLLLGFALVSNSWVFALVAIPLSLGLHTAIVAAEEDFLHAKFGPHFDAYCARVNRWMPRLSGLARTLRGMQFDWRRVVIKEYRAGFDWFSATAMIVLIRLGQESRVDDYQMLTAVMVLVIAARFVLWFASRQLNKRTPPATAGA
jgi:protein-S-isoprenylcysteine O-methyltransferase Ste14